MSGVERREPPLLTQLFTPPLPRSKTHQAIPLLIAQRSTQIALRSTQIALPLAPKQEKNLHVFNFELKSQPKEVKSSDYIFQMEIINFK